MGKALGYADRVQETSTTTGTGTLTLAGAVSGYQSFSSAFANGDAVYYTITDGTNWEVGKGKFTLSGTTLSRDEIFFSSNSNAAVNWGAGTRNVWCDLPAQVLADKGLSFAMAARWFLP